MSSRIQIYAEGVSPESPGHRPGTGNAYTIFARPNGPQHVVFDDSMTNIIDPIVGIQVSNQI